MSWPGERVCQEAQVTYHQLGGSSERSQQQKEGAGISESRLVVVVVVVVTVEVVVVVELAVTAEVIEGSRIAVEVAAGRVVVFTSSARLPTTSFANTVDVVDRLIASSSSEWVIFKLGWLVVVVAWIDRRVVVVIISVWLLFKLAKNPSLSPIGLDVYV